MRKELTEAERITKVLGGEAVYVTSPSGHIHLWRYVRGALVIDKVNMTVYNKRTERDGGKGGRTPAPTGS